MFASVLGTAVTEAVRKDIEGDTFRELQSAMYECVEGGARVVVVNVRNDADSSIAFLKYNIRQRCVRWSL
jgi:hypothetical protein